MQKYFRRIITQNISLASKNKKITPSSTQESSVNPIFNYLMSSVSNLIGDNMELQNLIGKNISVGKRIFNHPTFLQNMRDNSYFKN